MKTTLLLFLGLLLAGSTNLLQAQEATFTSKADRKALLEKVKLAEKRLINDVKNLTPEQWNYVPEDGGWSIAGVCEHILKAEFGFMEFANKVMQSPMDGSQAEAMRAKFDEILAYGTPEARAAQQNEAPAQAQPEGAFADPAQFIAAYQEALAKKREMIQNLDLRAHMGKDPLGNDQDAYNLLLFATAHTMRHTLQAEEVMKEKSYPAAAAK